MCSTRTIPSPPPGTDPEEGSELGQYRTDLVPTSFKKPDAQKLGEASDREYLCGYTVAVADTNPADLYQQVPNEAIAGYTLTRPHVAGDLDDVVAAGDAEGMRTESDAFRYYTSEGLTPSTAPPSAGLRNRFIDMRRTHAQAMASLTRTRPSRTACRPAAPTAWSS